MNVYLERTKEKFDIDFAGTVGDLLEKLQIVSEEVLILCNGQLVTEEELVENTDDIKILSVISGG